MALLSLMFAESPTPPLSAAGALTLRLPLSEALVVHAEKLPLSKPSLKIKSAGTVAVGVGVKVAVLVEVECRSIGWREGGRINWCLSSCLGWTNSWHEGRCVCQRNCWCECRCRVGVLVEVLVGVAWTSMATVYWLIPPLRLSLRQNRPTQHYRH